MTFQKKFLDYWLNLSSYINIYRYNRPKFLRKIVIFIRIYYIRLLPIKWITIGYFLHKILIY